MKVKMLLVAAALLALASISFGQNFVACLYDDAFVLTSACDGGAPLADGTVAHIYWDANNNGRDAADVLAPVGPGPEDVNFNTFTLNGDMMGMGAGTFLLDPCFASNNNTPSAPHYYVVVETAAVRWVSATFHLVVGPQEPALYSWTCTPLATPCVPSGNVTFPVAEPIPGPQNGNADVTLCTGTTLTVCVGPLHTHDANIAAGRLPHMNVTPGTGCTPATGYVASGWTLYLVNGEYFYCMTLGLGANGTEGCLHLFFDSILAAEMGDVTVSPLSNAVKVAWTTRSETNLNHFEVIRDGALVATKEATNNVSGSNYSYTDETAQNGVTYRYELVVVDANGGRQVVATESVTPSIENAEVTNYGLLQNYPNPFNPSTRIAFDLKDNNVVTLTIYNATGQEVSTLLSNANFNKGRHSVTFDATNLPSGLYFYTVKIGNEFSATKKMLLVK